MKLFISICVLVFFNFNSINGSFLNLGNFFRSSNSKTFLSTPSPSTVEVPAENNFPEIEPRSDEEDSPEAIEGSKSELEAYTYNSSLEQEFTNSSESWSSKEDSKGTVQSNASIKASDEAATSAENSADLKSNGSYTKSSDTNASVESSTADLKTALNKLSITPVRVSTDSSETSSTNITTHEQEEVVLGTEETSTTPISKTFYEKTIEWAEDEYTLSILIPITAGVVFALSIITTVAICRCIRRCCRRRRFRKHVLPDAVKTLRPSDRARLLGDFNSSDDEF